MSVLSPEQISERFRAFSPGSRLGYAVLLALVVISFGYGFFFQVISMNSETQVSGSYFFLYNLVVFLGFGALWLLLHKSYKARSASPARVFWTMLLLGLLFISAAIPLTSFGRDAELIDVFDAVDEFDYNTGAPLVVTTIFKSTFLSLFALIFTLYMIFRIKDLVLFKRTKTAQRNWYLMMAAMVVASLTFFMKSPREDPNILQVIALIPPLGLMVVNSLRASWIVYLNFKEKLISISLSTLLLIFLLTSVDAGPLPNPSPFLQDLFVYIQFYNYGLNIFVMLGIGFGVLYCTASLLLLLFHLPTTGDFQRKEHERAVMHSLTELINQASDPERLYAQIAASPVEAGSAQASWLAVADPQSGSLTPQIVATNKVTPGRVSRLVDTVSLFSDVSASGAYIYLGEAAADHRLSVRPGDGFGSMLAVPLIAREETLGILFVTKDVTHGFEQDDIDAIQVYAAQAAIAMDNARLFEEQLEKERLASELDIAREVQRKLLPQHVPVVDGLTIAASNVSAERVGGDYYDFLALDDERLCLVIGDVSGKGASAAFYMAEMQGIFQSVSRLAPNPSEFLRHANAALAHSLEKNVFISAIYGMLNLKTEEFTMGRAGHCPVAMIDLAGNARYLRPAGLGLGLDRGQLFEKTLQEERISLNPGDVFVLYTDGVVESRDVEGEEYGYDRLLESLKQHRHEDAEGIHDAILGDLDGFLGIESYDDDMTLVVLKWNGINLASAQSNSVKAKKSAAQIEQKID
ncbi:MAG: GAF domain-containing SpoIIE family protein phosphatase [Bacteroidota bacterium]